MLGNLKNFPLRLLEWTLYSFDCLIFRKKFYKSNSTGKGLKRPLPDTSDTQEVEQTKTPFIRKVNVAGLSDQTDRSG